MKLPEWPTNSRFLFAGNDQSGIGMVRGSTRETVNNCATK